MVPLGNLNPYNIGFYFVLQGFPASTAITFEFNLVIEYEPISSYKAIIQTKVPPPGPATYAAISEM
jgi:hypothetical protein